MPTVFKIAGGAFLLYLLANALGSMGPYAVKVAHNLAVALLPFSLGLLPPALFFLLRRARRS